MPKRHRQPEPIDIAELGKDEQSSPSLGQESDRSRKSPTKSRGNDRHEEKALKKSASLSKAAAALDKKPSSYAPATIHTITADRRKQQQNAPSRQRAAQTAYLHGHDMRPTGAHALGEKRNGQMKGNDDDDDEDEHDGELSDENEDFDSDEEEGSEMDSDGEEDEEDEDDFEEDDEEYYDSEDEEEYQFGNEEDSDSEGEDEDGEDDDDAEDSDEEGDEQNITVDFGVFDMEQRHVDATIHLMDQFCPDKMNEVDRDDFAAALIESPYTSIVKLTDGGDEEEDAETEQEVCGLCSVLHFYNCLSRHSAAFKALETLLRDNVWRTASPGIPPLDLLRAVKEDDNQASVKDPMPKMKALLWVFEQIQTVPIELTVQVITDTLLRLETDAAALGESSPEKKKTKRETSSSGDNKSAAERVLQQEAASSFPCLFVMLAKVQRAVSSEPTSPPQKSSSSGSSKQRSQEEKQRKKGNHKRTVKDDNAEDPVDFVLSDYVFWREEDEVFFSFRDKRVAVMVYRCRPQYEGQPEQEIPLSLMFAIQNGAVHQATEEMKKRALAPSSVTRFR